MTKRIAFFGTPHFTTLFLDMLKESGYTPSLIVTNPDKPIGRGMVFQSPAPKEWADAHEVAVLQPEKLDDTFFETLQKEPWDLFIVIAYGKIIPERIISLPQHSTINLHYSLLPKYRGATPVESAILHGDSVTGVSIQQMRYALDTGPVIEQTEVAIDTTDTTPSLREKLNTISLSLFPSVLDRIMSGTVHPQEQNEENASHCTKIQKEDGELSLSDDPTMLDRKYRAYFGSIGTFFFTEKKGSRIRVKITNAHLSNGQFVIDEVIPENGKRMSYEAFTASLNS